MLYGSLKERRLQNQNRKSFYDKTVTRVMERRHNVRDDVIAMFKE